MLPHQPLVRPLHRLINHLALNLNPQPLQLPEPRQHIQRDPLIRRPTRKPRPRPILQLQLIQLRQHPRRLRFQSRRIKQNPRIPPLLALLPSLPQPRGLLHHHRLQIPVLQQRALQRLRLHIPPHIKHPPDLRITQRQMPRQHIRIVPVEGLLRTLMRKLHQVRQRHHRRPRRTTRQLHTQSLMPQCLRPTSRP